MKITFYHSNEQPSTAPITLGYLIIETAENGNIRLRSAREPGEPKFSLAMDVATARELAKALSEAADKVPSTSIQVRIP